VRAERGAGLGSLRGRRFDATIDNLCYDPEDLKQVVRALGDGAGHYMMTSTVFVDEPVVRPQAVLGEDDADLEGTPDGYPDEPHARYVYGKRQCELLLRTTSLPFPWTIIRPVNIYGASDPQHRLRWWIARATDGQPVVYPDDFPVPSGERNNLMVYSGDVAAAQLACLGNPAAIGRTYLLAMDEALSVQEFVKAIAAAAGQPTPVLVKAPRALLDQTLLGDNPARTFRVPILWPGVRVSNVRAKEELGWYPTAFGNWFRLVVRAILAEASAAGWPPPAAYESPLEARLARLWLELQAHAGQRLVEEFPTIPGMSPG